MNREGEGAEIAGIADIARDRRNRKNPDLAAERNTVKVHCYKGTEYPQDAGLLKMREWK
jgi:hypothetical protein